MASKTRMAELVKSFRAKELAAALGESPQLLGVRDERGRNWLHLCCSVKPAGGERTPARSIKTADVLLGAGLELDREAFREGSWKATPLWYAVARGENPALVKHLLGLGADPNHCLWATGFRDDVATIKRLVAAGAEIDAVAEDETPFLGAVKTSHFKAAKALLELGADPDFQDRKRMTALHYMLKKGSDEQHLRMVVSHGARGDLPDPQGRTAAQILARKRSPALRKLAERLGAT
jgi:ankyrin repeat protein